jgi:hypothetical protein
MNKRLKYVNIKLVTHLSFYDAYFYVYVKLYIGSRGGAGG